MASAPRQAGIGQALRWGLGRGIGNAVVLTGLFACDALSLFAGHTAAAVLAGGSALPGLGVAASLGGLAMLGLSALLARAFFLGAALRQADADRRGETVPPLLEAGAAAFSRACGREALGGALALAAGMYQILCFGTAGWAFGASLAPGGPAVPASAALAAAATLCLPLGLVAFFWAEVAFARSIARSEPYAVALFRSAGALWEQPWKAFGVAVAVAFLSAAATLALSGPFSLGSWWMAGFPSALGTSLLGALAATPVLAYLDLSRLLALLSLEEDAPESPAEPIAEPIVDALPVLPRASAPADDVGRPTLKIDPRQAGQALLH